MAVPALAPWRRSGQQARSLRHARTGRGVRAPAAAPLAHGSASHAEHNSHGPERVPVHRHSIWYYFGGMTLFLFIVQVVSGIMLVSQIERRQEVEGGPPKP